MGHFNNRAKLTTGMTWVGHNWVTITTSARYGADELVVVATPIHPTTPGSVIQVRNVTEQSFELRAEQVEVDRRPIPVLVSWIAMQAGVYRIDRGDGTAIKFEAARIESRGSDSNLSLSGRRAYYQQSYDNPVVVGQVMTNNDEWSTFWARGPIFNEAPDSGNLFVGHHTGRVSDKRLPETLGIMVFEAGDDEVNGIRITAGLIDTAIDAADPAAQPIPFAATTAVASPAGLISRIGFWPVLTGHGPDDALDGTLRLRLASDGPGRLDSSDRVGYVAINTDHDVSRFLIQAGFGADDATLAWVGRRGYLGWIDDQASAEISLTEPYLESLNLIERPFGAVTEGGRTEPEQIAIRDQYAHNFSFANEGNPDATNHATIWMRNLIRNDDQLRQRVTFALSQIMVISQNSSRLKFAGASMASYYDTLSANALGNFRELLGGVSFHPAMAYYLSHIGNRKPDPVNNQFPDENYAREVMQLFTIGLWELNPDGSRQLDAAGQPIPTYNNDDITNLARVFTGLWYEGYPFGEPAWMLDVQGYTRPGLAMFDEWHDTDAKVIFADKPWRLDLAANTNGLNEINTALDALFTHPNMAPFISRRLIQFLTVSNPTPGYIERVGAVFNNNGAGVRGDLLSVIKAILLDTEARGYFPERPDYGKLIEPIIRFTRMIKAFRAGADLDDLVFWRHTRQINEFGQWPLNSPSVFNFFEPDYQHQGPLSEAGVFSPELQIHNPVTAITMPNELADMIDRLIQRYKPAVSPQFAFNFTDELALANDPGALVDRLDTLLCAGQMSPSMREIIVTAINRIDPVTPDDLTERVRLAVWLCAVSPDAAVLI